jgi:hypothetical protein
MNAAHSEDAPEEAARVSSEIQEESDAGEGARDGGYTPSRRTVRSSSGGQRTDVTGFHVGASSGADKLGCKLSKKKGDEADKKDDDKNTESTIGFAGEMFIGYDYQVGPLFLGADLVANIRTSKSRVKKDKDKPGLRVGRGPGFGAKPRIGLMFGSFGVYTCFGIDFARYKTTQANADPETKDKKDKAEVNKPDKENETDRMFIPNLGFGIEYNLGSVFIGFEYVGACDKDVEKVDDKLLKAGARSISAKLGYRF